MLLIGVNRVLAGDRRFESIFFEPGDIIGGCFNHLCFEAVHRPEMRHDRPAGIDQEILARQTLFDWH